LGKSIGDTFLDLVLQVELKLLIELPLRAAAVQNGLQPQPRREPPVFYSHGFY
jgi:hypothetical protein